jgi:hypothetical protein
MPAHKKVLICGDRNWLDRETICAWIAMLQDWGYKFVIEGEAPGADTIAREEAEAAHMIILSRDSTAKGFPAQWSQYGRAAGPIRNREMLDQRPDLVLAFHPDITKPKGTADCIKEAKRRGIEVILCQSNPSHS